MSHRPSPYPAYSFVLYLSAPDHGEMPIGGFSDATGLPHTQTGPQTIGDVTLKRGVVNFADLGDWITAACGHGGAGRRDAIVTQRNAVNVLLMSWRLTNAKPVWYSGPTLCGESGDASIEELVLSVEQIDIELSTNGIFRTGTG
jgi:phage tail-like protein